jgi:hypothetical protein
VQAAGHLRIRAQHPVRSHRIGSAGHHVWPPENVQPFPEREQA